MSVTTLVFDAYGTLVDVAGAARAAAADAPALAGTWAKLAEDWRRKQLEYTWQRAMTGQHATFDQVTADALDWALEAQGIEDPDLRARLLALYNQLPAYPEVPEVLAQLKSQGLRLAILSNGSTGMLAAATAAAGIEEPFSAILSVEQTRIFKPAWQVYALVEKRLHVPPQQVMFVSANGWDIAGAATFGFHTTWVNRSAAPMDRLPGRPRHIIPDLTHLPRLIQ